MTEPNKEVERKMGMTAFNVTKKVLKRLGILQFSLYEDTENVRRQYTAHFAPSFVL